MQTITTSPPSSTEISKADLARKAIIENDNEAIAKLFECADSRQRTIQNFRNCKRLCEKRIRRRWLADRCKKIEAEIREDKRWGDDWLITSFEAELRETRSDLNEVIHSITALEASEDRSSRFESPNNFVCVGLK